MRFKSRFSGLTALPAEHVQWSPVQLRGTPLPTLSSDSFRKLLVICELLNTLSAVEILHDSALSKFTIGIDIDIVLILSVGGRLRFSCGGFMFRLMIIMIMTDGWCLQQWPSSPITIQQNKSSIGTDNTVNTVHSRTSRYICRTPENRRQPHKCESGITVVDNRLLLRIVKSRCW